MSWLRHNLLRNLRHAFLFVPIWIGPLQKTDVVILKNGDHITCDIKQLFQGMLQVKTDSMGTIQIEWEDVARVVSKNLFEVEAMNGRTQYGRLVAPGEESNRVLLDVDGEIVELDKDGIAMIRNIDEGDFWDHLDGSLKLGFSYTRASDVAQLSFGLKSLYKTQRDQYDFSLDSISTSSPNNPSSTRSNASLTYLRRLKYTRWFGAVSGTAQSNDELGLDLRTILALEAGRKVKQSHKQVIYVSGGLSANREWNRGPAPPQNNLEGIVTADWKIFVYNTPKTNLSAKAIAYPSITQYPRFRFNTDISYRQELVKDFFFDISLYVTYDSEPPKTAFSTTDYGIVTSLGYSF